MHFTINLQERNSSGYWYNLPHLKALEVLQEIDSPFTEIKRLSVGDTLRWGSKLNGSSISIERIS